MTAIFIYTIDVKNQSWIRHPPWISLCSSVFLWWYALEDETLLYYTTHAAVISFLISCILPLLPGFQKALPSFFGIYSSVVIQVKVWTGKMQEYRPTYVTIFWRVNDIYSVVLDFTSFNVLHACDTEEI